MTRFERFKRRKKPDPLRDEWYTPPEFVRSLGEFDLDPSAGPETNHAPVNWTKTVNGFDREWFGRVWLNPPFLERRRWAEKLAKHGSGILLLNATGFEAAWFQRVIAVSKWIVLPHRRVYFYRPAGVSVYPPSGQVLIGFSIRDRELLKRWPHPALHLQPTKLIGK